MGRSTFGMSLREARERQGISIDSASSRLRIRPDILRSIEEGDFSRMPQRGYARNMINAYARYLGLNPTEITTLYLDELHAYQASVQGASFDRVANPQRGSRDGRSRRGAQREEQPAIKARRTPMYSESTGRPIYSDRTDRNPIYDQDDYGRRERHIQQDRARRQRNGSRPSGFAAPAATVGRSRTYDNLFSANKTQTIVSKLPLIIGALVVIALLVFVVSSVVSCTTNKPEANTANVPITGISDTTNSNSNVNTTPEPVKVAPTAASFQYTIAEGKSAYVEIYENGSTSPSIADEIQGPSTGTYQVTTTLKFITTLPEAVKLTVDGAEVTPTDKNDGVYVYTVDFPAILQAWNSANGVKTTASTTSSTAASNTNGASNTTSSNSSSTPVTTGTPVNAARTNSSNNGSSN